MHRHHPKLIYFTSLALMCLLGCFHKPSSEELAKRKAEIEEKVTRFESLQEDLNSGKLKAGRPQAEVKELYGKPDDIIRSSTGVSTMEIWSYERVLLDKNDDSWLPIRLYFNNSKLVSWIF